jgi:hypothetical protein
LAYIFNGASKRIDLTLGTTEIGVRDLLSRWADWVAVSDNSKYLPAFNQVGGNVIDASSGTTIPIYAFLLNGWRIRPQEASHTLIVGDGILLVDGGGDPFLNTLGSYTVRINYQQPLQAITVATGGGTGSGGLTSTESMMLAELWKIHGLESGAPLTVTPSTRIAGSIVQTISELPGDTTVVSRP